MVCPFRGTQGRRHSFMPTTPTTRIESRFRELRARQAKGLVVYLTAGDPSLEATGELLVALDRAGVDVIELGVPFSDPLADGPVIQRASERAVRGGTTLRRILERFPQWRESVRAPIILFSYYNPILQYGLENFARDAAQAGVDGALAVDLSPEEASVYVEVMHARNLDTIFLASPTSTDARLERASQLILRFSLSGFAHGSDGRAQRDFGQLSNRWWSGPGGTLRCPWRWGSAFQVRPRCAPCRRWLMRRSSAAR